MLKNLKLFVNYRRADHALFVENLRTHFMYRYGRENVFMDFDSIPPFTHFADFIREQVRAVDALVMIIGPRWVELLQQKAAAGEDDYVLIELEEAIQHGKVIAPILIMDAPFPDKRLLPDFLHPVFDQVNIPSLRPGLDTLNNIDRLTSALENEIKKQGKQRSIQQDTPPQQQFNIQEAVGYFYEAQHNGDLPAALIWLEKIRHSGAAIPGFFKIDEYETNLQALIKQQEDERRRREVADYLYGFVRQMVRYQQPKAEIADALMQVWEIVPDYDPDGFRDQGFGEVVASGPRKGHSLENFAAEVRQIIGEPFEWCEVPAGPFLMGSDRKKDKNAYDQEPNLHEVTLPGFYIARYPITYAQFQTFIDAKDGIADDRWWAGLAEQYGKPFEQTWTVANHPREMVNWYQAMAFCRWLSHRLGGEYALDEVSDWLVRLPIEAEWEKAARGTDGLIYPWGDAFDKNKCNTSESGFKKTTPVDKYPAGASPYGVRDMSGNVWEWCLSEWTEPYEHQSVEQVDITTITGRVLRGGSWYFGRDGARAAARHVSNPYNRLDNFGFRVCGSAPITLNSVNSEL